jgi:tRNA(Ile)-lysidine synthase
MSHSHPLELKLAASWAPSAWQDVTVLVAVSGGADSVALLRALTALKSGGEGRLAAAHVNHQLRAAEAEADERFVVDLCRTLAVPCEVGRVEVDRVRSSGEGIESAARRARYLFLQQAAARLGARYVVTAHTADDQVETILHRILRGTGLRGLSGMARARGLGPVTLIRPFLGIRREELLAYLQDLGQPYRRDSTNQDLRFTRNRIRLDLLPLLARQFNPEILDALLRLGVLAGEAQAVLDRQLDALADRCVRYVGESSLVMDTAALAGQPRYVVRELLAAVWRVQGWPRQAMGFREWDMLADMVLAGENDARDAPRKRTLPGNVQVERDRTELRLSGANAAM